jgi:membrane dipeptidase
VDDAACPLVFDAHLDLSMNALEWNRDLRWTVPEIRESERGMTDKPDRGRGTVSFDAMRRGRVGLCAATLIARYVKPGGPIPGWHSQEQAWAQTQGQMAWYRAMEDAGELRPITTIDGLDEQVGRWRAGDPPRPDPLPQRGAGTPAAVPPALPGVAPDVGPGVVPVAAAEEGTGRRPIGYILTLEGADSLVTLGHLERGYAQGLRAVGPAHYGPGVYAQGTNASGGLGERGRGLLREMERLGIILDASHLCDESFWESLDVFRGPVWASHSNCRALVPHNRQLSDDQIGALIARGAVIGIALDAWMLVPGWERPASTPAGAGLTLAQVADHIDHVCQLAGDSRHVGIGSDLDGAFGTEQCPADVDTIADLQDLPARLTARGFAAGDIASVCSGNFVRFLREAWSRP